jgi:hypothetical protein
MHNPIIKTYILVYSARKIELYLTYRKCEGNEGIKRLVQLHRNIYANGAPKVTIIIITLMLIKATQNNT